MNRHWHRKNKIGYFGQNKILRTSIKSMISALTMGGITYISYKLLGNSLGVGIIMETLSLTISIIIGMITYGVLVIILKVDEVNTIIEIIKTRLNRS